MARELGVDLAALQGSGPRGRIVKADVEAGGVPAAPVSGLVLSQEVDMYEAVAFRERLAAAAGDGVAPSLDDLVVKAAAMALRELPHAHGSIDVVAAGTVRTIAGADAASLGAIARGAGAGREPASTFTVITGLGVTRCAAALRPAQAATLAVGALTPRTVVRGGEIAVRPVTELTITCDARILDAADAARFLVRMRERLESPLSLIL
jgi:pyruvate dehydrogenase E2 component (dihydrolipoamide acetyltransferase)